jgi:hypothetical protein
VTGSVEHMSSSINEFPPAPGPRQVTDVLQAQVGGCGKTAAVVQRLVERAPSIAVAIALAAAAGAPAAVRADDPASGALVGSVTDASGRPLAGVKVTASSDTQIGGARVAYTRDDGSFRIVALSPGSFAVAATADQLKAAARRQIRVGLGAPATVHLIMDVETDVEEITIADKGPAVSATSATVKQVLDEDFIDHLPSDFKLGAESVIAGAVPGVVSPGLRTMRVRGGGINQTAILVEGFDMVGQRSTLKGMAAIEMATAAYGAEYATVPGGVLNMVTKSGSNRFDVDVTGFAEDSQLAFFLQPADSRERAYFYVLNPNVSGPIVKDRLWFFANLEARREQYADPSDPQGLLPRNPDRIYGSLRGSAKLTWQATPRNKLISFSNFNLRSNTNLIRNYAPATQAEAQSRTEDQDWMTGLIWEALLSDSVLLKSQLAVQGFSNHLGPAQCQSNPACDSLPAIVELQPRELAYGNFNRNAWTLTRKGQLINTLELFPRGRLLGQHNVKLKTDVAVQEDTLAQSVPGDRRITLRAGAPERQTEFFANDPRLEDARHGRFSTDTSSWRLVASLSDSWQPGRYLTITPGVALVRARARGGDGGVVLDATAATTHLSAAWDATHDGRTVLRASANTYLDVSGADLARFTAGSQVSRTCSWDAVGGAYTRECAYAGGASGRTVGLPCGPTGHNPDGSRCAQSLRVPRTWEYTLGAERELVPGLNLAGDAIYRVFTHPYEQVETNRVWNRSGSGLEPLGSYRNGRAEAVADLETPDGARRSYLGLTAALSKREGPLRLNAAYTWSALRGNVLDSAYNQAYGEIAPRDPLLYGYLPDDSRHNVRATAALAVTPWLSCGAIYNYQSGRPYQRRFRNAVTGGFDDYRAPPGTDPGRNLNDPGDDRALRLPDLQQLSLQARLDWRALMGARLGGLDAETYVDVLNVLALRTPLAVQENDAGTGEWGTPTELMAPFRLRIGFRVHW